ncbi:MAG: hypothetical protein ACI865_001169 [Flavobacteriaceae bacterium]|jgi:hypothetical protein
MKYILSIILILFSLIGFSQEVHQQRMLDSSSFATQKIELRRRFGHNKEIPEDFELTILTALSYFPELDSTTIIFKMKKINTSLNARPKFGSALFRRGFKRKYVVRICPPTAEKRITLDQVAFNGRVGVLGHEFNHLKDYSNRSFFGIIGRGFAYMTKKSKEKFEKEIDRRTIEIGLGWQLYDWAKFVSEESIATEKYKVFKRAIYLESAEIREIIESN